MKYGRFFAAMFVMVFLAGITELAGPVLLQVWSRAGTPLTVRCILTIPGVIAASKALSILLTVYREKFAEEYNRKNFLSMMSDFFGMDYDAMAKSGPANLLEKISIAVNSIYSYMTGGFIQIWSGALIALICLLLIAGIKPWLAACMFLALPLNYLGYKALNRKLAERSQWMQKETGRGFQEILSRVQNIDYIKQLSSYELALGALAPAAKRIYGSMARVNEFAQSMSIALSGMTSIIQNVVMLALVYSFSTGGISPYSLLLATLIMPVYFSSVSTIVNANINRHDYDVAVKFRDDMAGKREDGGEERISRIDEIELEVSGLKLPDCEIRFQANAQLHRGDIVQICGASGSGKTSFARAMLKFRPEDGIALNGLPIRRVSNRDLRRLIEYVPQSVPIVCGTLRENLLMNVERSGISDEQLLSHPLLRPLLAGRTLDVEVLENGANLSGGEKQKIALVRALLSEPEVLILDEICSNIDAATTEQIYRFLDGSRDSRITFIITHDALPEGLVNVWLNREGARL